jgi:hypothetical protein
MGTLSSGVISLSDVARHECNTFPYIVFPSRVAGLAASVPWILICASKRMSGGLAANTHNSISAMGCIDAISISACKNEGII